MDKKENVLEVREVGKTSAVPDQDAFFIHFTGGLRAQELALDKWSLDPTLSEPGATGHIGYFTKAQAYGLQYLNFDKPIKPIAFEQVRWSDGAHTSLWSPIIPGRKNHMLAPRDIWGNISGSFAGLESRLSGLPSNSLNAKIVADAADDMSEPERLSQNISMSFANLDYAVRQVSSFYQNQLVYAIISGKKAGQSWGHHTDNKLYAAVHSFFIHWGMARDYLATLIARRNDIPSAVVDSMTKLLKPTNFAKCCNDQIVNKMLEDGVIIYDTSKNTAETSGFLKTGSNIRNNFVHKRPYGSLWLETSGTLESSVNSGKIFRYFRPMVDINGQVSDLLDFVSNLYILLSKLFIEIASISGYDDSMLTLTDEDIADIKIVQ